MKAIVRYWNKTAQQLIVLSLSFIAVSIGQTHSLVSDKSHYLISNGNEFDTKALVLSSPSPSSEIFVSNSKPVPNNWSQVHRSLFERSRYWLNLTDDLGFFGQMMVAYMTGATNGYDPAIDGLFFGDSQTALTSIVENQEYIIQGRALPFETTDVVTLGFKSDFGGNYTITLNSFDGLFETDNQDIYLKDNLTTTLTNLKISTYNFNSAAGVFNSRFEVVYENLLGVETPVDIENKVIVYKQNQEIVIHSGTVSMSKVQLFDIQGRLLTEKNNIDATVVRINTDATTNVLIVKITTSSNEIIAKKVVN